VPFALSPGSPAPSPPAVSWVTAGLAEIAAGLIARSLGGYLAAMSDAGHYTSERAREESEIVAVPEAEAREVVEICEAYGVTALESTRDRRAAPMPSALGRSDDEHAVRPGKTRSQEKEPWIGTSWLIF